MGGLARRAGYIKALMYRSRGEVPTLFVDAGNLFSDDRYSGGKLPSWVMTKNRWVVNSCDKFSQDAANITHYDLPFLAELLKKEGYDQRVSEYPSINKVVSANVRSLSDSVASPQPYLIREITLKRGKPGHKVRIGIAGFTELKPVGAQDFVNEYAGFRIEDPFAAAKRVLPELKSKVDVVIALAYMSEDHAQRLAAENPEIDTVIGARQLNRQVELRTVNQAAVAFAHNQTKYLGELRFYVTSDGSVANRINRFVGLDDAVPDEPAAAEMVSAAHNEFTNEQNKEAQEVASTGPLAGLLDSSKSPYVGVETCKGCHVEAYDIWKESGHAHAMATLEARNQQFDTNCVGCHVVGYQNGGFEAHYSTPQFANVQCESCHGPGRKHIDNPVEPYGFMQTPTGCVQCHTKVNSPDFDFKSYWPKVDH